MAVVYQASGTLLGALTTADVTPAIPAHQADDILICITANRVITNTCATPSGWNLLYGPVDETAWRSYVFWKRATSGSETNPLCDWTATSADKYAQVHTFRGAITTGSPFAATAWTDGATDPAVATGVTTAAAGQLVAAIGLCADNLSTSATVTATDPASFGVTNSHTTIATGADATGFCYSATRATAGATGNVSVDFNAAPLHWGIVVAAFTEAPPPAGPTITPFESSWSTTTTPKDITVTGCLDGDLLVVLAGGDGGLSGNAVTASTVTTNSGSTGIWADIDKNLPASGGAGWVHSAQTDVTADGDVVVRLARTQTGTARVWGGCVLRCRNHGGVGNHVRSAPSATETASLTTSQDSAVGMSAQDYDALGAVAISPSGSVEVERAQQGSGPDMTTYAAYWLGQAAGTRGYGIATSSTTNLHIIAVEILAASTGTPVGKDLQAVWDTRAPIGDTVQAIWDTRAAVGDTLQAVWDVRSAVADTLGLVWHVRAALGDPLDLRWDVRAALGDPLQLVWNVQTLSTPVGKDLALVWNTRAVLGDPLQLVWDTRAALGDTLQAIWNTRTAVGDPVSLVWNTRTAIGDPIDLRWDVRAALADTLQLIWNVQVIGLTAIGKDLGLLWNLKAPAGDDLQVLWDTRAILADILDLRWGIRTPVGKASQMVWHVRTVAGDTLTLVWDVDSQAYVPLFNPAASVRLNAASASFALNPAMASPASNPAAATARPNPAEGTTS